MSFKRNKWKNIGKTPDYRFSLANERTFLAWIRTALALLAGAIAIEQLL
ncbi:YidH family protein, partial [Klebsiella pneumoniae]